MPSSDGVAEIARRMVLRRGTSEKLGLARVDPAVRCVARKCHHTADRSPAAGGANLVSRARARLERESLDLHPIRPAAEAA